MKQNGNHSLQLVEPSTADRELYAAAAKIIRQRFAEGRHHVGAAVRTRSGSIHVGVHLQGVIGEPAVCAEKVAIGKAMTAGDDLIQACVAIRHPKNRERSDKLSVLPPCGSCRELIADYGGENVWVLIEVDGRLVKTRIAELLPLRRWQRGASLPR